MIHPLHIWTDHKRHRTYKLLETIHDPLFYNPDRVLYIDDMGHTLACTIDQLFNMQVGKKPPIKNEFKIKVNKLFNSLKKAK